MKLRSYALLGLCMSTASSLLADFTYHETTKITGGAVVGMMKMAGMFSQQARKVGEPATVTVYLQGNRMARVDPDSTEIIDLDAGTVTHIDHHDRTFTTMTFEQMRQQLEAARLEAEKKMAEHPQPTQTPKASGEPAPEMKFKVKVRETGVKKDVSGLEASEAILAMQLEATDQKSGQKGAMAITNDMWMVPEIPGYGEVREFQKRFAVKMGRVLGGGMGGAMNPAILAMQPGMEQGLTDLAKEMSKLKGLPVLQVMRVGTTLNGEPLAAASEAPLPPSATPEMPSAGDVATQGATEVASTEAARHLGVVGSALGSSIGSFGGFGKKKKTSPPPANAATDAPAAATPTSAVLMESSTEMGGFSAASVDRSRFEVPAGYKQVQPKTH